MESHMPVILIVDDDINILHGYQRVFRKHKINVFTAQSAEEAKDALKRSKIDVVVSDECMKGCRGTELLAWVAEYFPNAVRIILTGQPSVPSMEVAINQSKVFRYLLKPVSPEELLTVIVEGLEAERDAQQKAPVTLAR